MREERGEGRRWEGDQMTNKAVKGLIIAGNERYLIIPFSAVIYVDIFHNKNI